MKDKARIKNTCKCDVINKYVLSVRIYVYVRTKIKTMHHNHQRKPKTTSKTFKV